MLWKSGNLLILLIPLVFGRQKVLIIELKFIDWYLIMVYGLKAHMYTWKAKLKAYAKNYKKLKSPAYKHKTAAAAVA